MAPPIDWRKWDIRPAIVFEDTHILVINKPAGLLSQGDATGDPHLVEVLQNYLGRPYVGLVHRLDRMTTGLMVVGKRSKSAERLSAQLQEGRLTRTYLALLEGGLRQEARWTHHLTKNPSTNQVSAWNSPRPGSKPAALRVTPQKWLRTLTLAQFELETGRSHQIRAQAAASGYPLLGDRKYGARDTHSIARPALHSWRMQLEHPMSKESLEFKAPLPEDFEKVLNSR